MTQILGGEEDEAEGEVVEEAEAAGEAKEEVGHLVECPNSKITNKTWNKIYRNKIIKVIK